MADILATPLKSDARRKIASLCVDTPRSVGDLAAALDRPDGAIRPTINKMVDAGILRSTQLPERRARGYVVAPAWQGIATKLANEPRAPGALVPEARFVHVRGTLDALAVALSDISEQPVFAWAARLGAEQFAVLFDGPKSDIDDAHAKLLRCRHVREELAEDVQELFTPMELRAWAAGVDRGRPEGGASSLPPAGLPEGDRDER